MWGGFHPPLKRDSFSQAGGTRPTDARARTTYPAKDVRRSIGLLGLATLPWVGQAVIGAGVLAAVLVVANFVPPLLIRRRQVAVLRRRFAGRLALTYDDGPDETLTPALLALLDRYQATATFFLVGFRAERHAEECERIAQAGHEVGCHGQWHRHVWKQWPWRAARDIDDGCRTLSRWMADGGVYRPPWGKLTTWAWLGLRRLGLKPVWWTDVSGDTFARLPDVHAVCRRVLEASGGVLLLHGFHKEPARRQFVLAVTEGLLEAAAREGLAVCTLSQGLAHNDATEVPPQPEARRAIGSKT